MDEPEITAKSIEIWHCTSTITYTIHSTHHLAFWLSRLSKWKVYQ